ncbi:hypothetical protein NBRC116495_22340 [Aurantivibrio plasticivorans]
MAGRAKSGAVDSINCNAISATNFWCFEEGGKGASVEDADEANISIAIPPERPRYSRR